MGYGDFLPKSAIEKMIMAFILLIGVTIFSLIMNKLMEVLKDFKEIEIVNGQNPRDLAKWLALLGKINDGMPLNKAIVNRIEDFFEFYWINDRLRAFKGTIDSKILNEL